MKLTRDIHSLSTFKRDTAKLVRQLKKNGQPVVLKADAQFNVTRPDLKFTGIYGPATFAPLPPDGKKVKLSCRMRITAPQKPEGGILEWVQTGVSVRKTEGVGDPFVSIQSGCDTSFPYSTFDGNDPIDEAGIEVFLPQWLKAEARDSFNMWLMFKSDKAASIYVPLARGSWVWRAGAQVTVGTKGPEWEKRGLQPATLRPINGASTIEFPEWWSHMVPRKQP